MSGTARTRSYVKATACSAPTLSTTAVTNRWGTLGTISTLLLSGARKSGSTRRRAILRHRRTSGGIGTTSTAKTKPPPRSSNRFVGAAQQGKLAARPRDRSRRKRVGVGDDRTWEDGTNNEGLSNKGNKNDGAEYHSKGVNIMTKTNDLAEAIIVERTYDAPVGRVWTALTDVDEMRQWYFDLKEFNPETGCEFDFVVEHEGNIYHHLCKVTEVIPQKKIAYTWRYKGEPGNSLVTFELFPEGNKTRLKLTH